MHELSIATEMIKQVEDTRIKEKSERVLAVTAHIGELSGIDGSALEMAFQFAAEDTGVQGAELIIKAIPVTVSCLDCSKTSNPTLPFLVCGACGSTNVKIESGRDLIIKTVRME